MLPVWQEVKRVLAAQQRPVDRRLHVIRLETTGACCNPLLELSQLAGRKAAAVPVPVLTPAPGLQSTEKESAQRLPF